MATSPLVSTNPTLDPTRSRVGGRAWQWRYAEAPSDHTPLFYEQRGGDVAGTVPVVWCDGIGCDGYIWRYLGPALAAHPVLHPHYRGHGRTPAPRDPERVDITDLADDVAAVMNDAGVGGAVLMGHSMGVQVALETYRRHRTRVRGLVLICGAPGQPLKTFAAMSSLDDVLPRIQGLLAKTPGIANWVSRQVLPTRLSFEIAARLEIRKELIDPSDFMPYLAGMSHVDTSMFVSMLRAIGRHSAEDMLADIDVPTLVVAGARDGFTPPSRSRDMAAAIPGATYLEVPDGSHTAPLERPQLVCDEVGSFVQRVVPTNS